MQSEAATGYRAARLTPAENEALERLLDERAAELEKSGQAGDRSFAGWFRAVIRKEAREHGFAVAVDGGAAAPTKAAKKPAPKRATKGARK